jgi:hypothetical protein
VKWGYLLSAVALAIITFVLSLIFVAFLLVQLPATYFLDSHNRELWIDRHPVIRWSARILKNLLGIGIVIVGGLLSLPGIPGQGLLTILIGLMLVDFPGKRRLERSILSRPRISRWVDRLRDRWGKPPFELPPGTHR